jgi:4-carboxymuconolactone decarboxylase
MGDQNSDRRLPPLPPDRLDDDQLALYQAITEGPRARDGRAALIDADGQLQGPFDPMLRSPVVGEALQQLGATLRYRTSLPALGRS